jgi:hypothetical protein
MAAGLRGLRTGQGPAAACHVPGRCYLGGMNRTQPTDATDPRDFTLAEACLLCGGDLTVRLTAGSARTYCATCRWISRPHVSHGEDGVQVFHPAGLVG